MSIRFAPVLLACTVSTAHADALYRWVEPDGTLTFSATPPAEDIRYHEVEVSTESATIVATEPAADARDEPRTGEARAPAPALDAGAATEPARGDIGIPGAPRRTTRRMHTASRADATPGCMELRNRVTSLERRLQQDLTATQMDNAVVRIAQYQRDIDHRCDDQTDMR